MYPNFTDPWGNPESFAMTMQRRWRAMMDQQSRDAMLAQIK